MMWDFGQFSGRVAAADEWGRTLYYEELEEENRRFKEALGKRSLVFVLCSNTMGSLAGYTGCINGGSVPLLLARNLDEELLTGLLNLYRPDYLWVPEDLIYKFECMSARYKAFGYVLLETGYERGYGSVSYTHLTLPTICSV